MACNQDAVKNILTETDRHRILCVFLSSKPANVDWDKATKLFGTDSVKWFRESTRTMLKKIEKASGKGGGNVEDGKVCKRSFKPVCGRKRRKVKDETPSEDESVPWESDAGVED